LLSIIFVLHLRDARPWWLGALRIVGATTCFRFLSFPKEIIPFGVVITQGYSIYNWAHPLTEGVFFICLYAAFGPRFFILY